MTVPLVAALGMLIVYTAFAGFRSASQMIAFTQRQSRVNAVLRASIVYAYELAHNRFGDLSNQDEFKGTRSLPARVAIIGIRSLSGFGNLVKTPSPISALPPR